MKGLCIICKATSLVATFVKEQLTLGSNLSKKLKAPCRVRR